MNAVELEPVIRAFEILESRGVAATGLRQIIIDDRLKCPRKRRRYASVVLRLAEGPPEGLGRFDLSAEDLARTGADTAPCECGRCDPKGGSCSLRTP